MLRTGLCALRRQKPECAGNVVPAARACILYKVSFCADVYKRQIVANKYGKEIADNTSILYGGSCKPSNAKELFSNPDVDGGLIGGAALKVSDFKGIIDAFNA